VQTGSAIVVEVTGGAVEVVDTGTAAGSGLQPASMNTATTAGIRGSLICRA
jgi:hypothetical protein